MSLLAERVAERWPSYQVVNESVSGETTGGGLARLPGVLGRHEPQVLVLELGGNDALRGYSIAAAHENLYTMARLARTKGAEVIVAGMMVPPNYGPRYSRAFAGIFTRVAEETNSHLIPFLLEGIATNPALMQSDGIHPNAEAQPLILDIVWGALVPVLESGQSRAPSASPDAPDAPDS